MLRFAILLACTVSLTGCEAFWIWMAVDAAGGEEDAIEAAPDPSGAGGATVASSGATGGGEGGSTSASSTGQGGETSTSSTSSGTGGSGGGPPVCVPKTCADFGYPACGELSDGCDGTLSCSAGICPEPWQSCSSGACRCTNALGLPNGDNAADFCANHGGGNPYYCGDGETVGPPNCEQRGIAISLGGGASATLWCCM